MNATRPIMETIRKNLFKFLAAVAILIAFGAAMWVNFGVRAAIEAEYKTVGLMVDYDDLGRIAGGNPEISFSDMLKIAYDAGANELVVRERILAEWEIAGDILTFSGGQLGFYLDNQSAQTSGSAIQRLGISTTKTYILTNDQLVYDQLFAMLDAKSRNPEHFYVPGFMCIAVQLHSSERATLGMGFPIAQLREAAEAGFQIIPRLRNWEPLTPESLEEVLRWVQMIPNFYALGFNDQTVPGDGEDPDMQDMLANAIAPLGKPIISFEFYDQTGLPGLAARLDNNLIRVHSIADGDLRRYSEFQVAMDRYSLAATERNIRIIYLKFQDLASPGASYDSNLELLTGVHDGLVSEGLTIGNPVTIPYFKIGPIPIFLLGVGVIAAGGWLLAIAAEPFAKKKWYKPYRILVVAGFFVWAALIFIAPTLSRKVFSLAAAIVFPCLSVLIVLIYQPKARTTESGVRWTIRCIGLLLEMSVMTWIGSMIMSALLADPVFMLKLDSFFGVKISHEIPIILVPCILWLREKEWYGIASGTIKSSVKYWQVVVGAVLLFAFFVYVMRTGNESPELVTGFELKVRQILNDILVVRPRTKEFLIGHPLMIVLLYFGYNINMFPVVMAGIIGQISIMNTYAHIHTPLAVSLLRSGNGLWIGILIGIVAVIILPRVIRLILSSLKKLEDKQGNTPEKTPERKT